MRSGAVKTRVRFSAVPCGRVRSCAVECGRVRSSAVVRDRVRSCAISCGREQILLILRYNLLSPGIQCVNLSIEEKPADESDPSLCGISRMSPTPFERDLFFTMLQLVHMHRELDCVIPDPSPHPQMSDEIPTNIPLRVSPRSDHSVSSKLYNLYRHNRDLWKGNRSRHRRERR